MLRIRLGVVLGLSSALLFSGVALAAPSASTTSSGNPGASVRAQEARKYPGALYAASAADLSYKRVGNRVQVDLPAKTSLAGVSATGRGLGGFTLGSLQGSWSDLGMGRKGSSFWIRPAGATRVVHLYKPTAVSDGKIRAWAALSEWNGAVSSRMRLTSEAPLSGRAFPRQDPGNSTEVAVQSMSDVTPCNFVGVVNWVGTCVYAPDYGLSLPDLSIGFTTTGYQASLALCWELTAATPSTATVSVQYEAMDAYWTVEDFATLDPWSMRALVSGQCTDGKHPWINAYTPDASIATGLYDFGIFKSAINWQWPTTSLAGFKLYVMASTVPALTYQDTEVIQASWQPQGSY